MRQRSTVVCGKAWRRLHWRCAGPLLILGSTCGLTLVGHTQEADDFTVHEVTLGNRATWIETIEDGRAVGWGRIPGDHADTDIHAFLWTEAAGIRDLGTLGGNHSEAHAVDGDRVVGFSAIEVPEDPENPEAAEVHAFLWTPSKGMRDLGTLGGTYSAAFGVSGGQVVGESTTASGEMHAFRWTVAKGMVDLGTLADGTESSAVAVHNGLVAGWSTTFGDSSRTRRPVAWNAAGEIVDLVDQPLELREDGFVLGSGEATDVRDGMVVGFHSIPPEQSPCEPGPFCSLNRAFAWTRAGGITNLGTLPGDFASAAAATSGRQVVGGSSSRALARAFRWTAAGGMIDLGTLGSHAEALDVRNGKVVGFFLDPEGDSDNENAFLWTPETGMIDVSQFDRSRAVGIDAAGRIALAQLPDIVADAAGGRAAVLVGPDTDGDGVTDAGDDCPDSIIRRKVVIDGCKTEVPNTVLTNGCTVSDEVASCAEGARNHGQFVDCVSKLSKALKKDGIIIGKQKNAIQRCAARSDLP